jgi:glycosyltransferase involved in cell wall biosynthesis
MEARKVVIIGPAHPLRGGLATFNERLARQFISEGFDTSIYTFSLQYPKFIFPGTTQYSDEPAPEGLHIKVCINSVNPFNWLKVGRELKKMRPDIIVVRYWLPLMGPCLGTILRRVKKNRHTKIICIADNIIPHEKRTGDKPFTRYFIKPVDAFITMSEKVMQDLQIFTTQKPALQVNHPLYDSFGEAVPVTEARKKLGLAADEKIILFFGFIRKYKGLDVLLDALNILKLQPGGAGCKLLIAGEFYEDEKPYLQQIKDNGLEELIILKTSFIADSEVRYYLCAANCVVQPYRNATQSGVTPLAYHFEKPMIVTNVGGLPALVPNGVAGLVAEPDAQDIATKINEFFATGEAAFLPGLRTEKKKYAWNRLTAAIVSLAAGKQ